MCVWNQHINTNTPPTSTSTAHNSHSHWRHTRRVVCLNDGHTLKRSLCIKVAILHYKPYSVTVHHIIFPCFLAAHAHVWLTDSSRVDLVQLDATRSDFILHKIGEIGKGMNEHVFVFVCVCVQVLTIFQRVYVVSKTLISYKIFPTFRVYSVKFCFAIYRVCNRRNHLHRLWNGPLFIQMDLTSQTRYV